MDIKPVNAGHLLVVPLAHATSLADLPRPEPIFINSSDTANVVRGGPDSMHTRCLQRLLACRRASKVNFFGFD